MDTKDLKPLISALENGYRYRNHEILGFFLSATMSLWGLPEWQSVPEDVQPKIAAAIDAYADIVAAQPPFMDVLGPLYMGLGSRGASQSGLPAVSRGRCRSLPRQPAAGVITGLASYFAGY